MRTIALGALVVALVSGTLGAQQQQGMAESAIIRNAMSAAPAAVAEHATIMNWPAMEGGKMVQLRAGTNGWTCFPTMPTLKGNAPMCLDKPWTDWADALMAKRPPNITTVGIGYMIAPGGANGSNNDPYAKDATADNEWGFDPPHVMILVPDLKSLEGLPTKRSTGAPWVMYAGTPYAHIMVPVKDAAP